MKREREPRLGKDAHAAEENEWRGKGREKETHRQQPRRCVNLAGKQMENMENGAEEKERKENEEKMENMENRAPSPEGEGDERKEHPAQEEREMRLQRRWK